MYTEPTSYGALLLFFPVMIFGMLSACLLLVFLGSLIEVLLRLIRRPAGEMLQRGKWFLATLLFLFALPSALLWDFLVFGKLYWHFDGGLDFTLFGLILAPTTGDGIRTHFAPGIRLWMIYGLWFLLAGSTWALAIWLSRRLVRARVDTHICRCILFGMAVLTVIATFFMPCY